MAKPTADERIAELELQHWTEADLTKAQSILDGMHSFTVSIVMSPIPMRTGKYGYNGSTTVKIDGENARVGANYTPKSNPSKVGPLEAAFAELARRRVADMQSGEVTATPVNVAAAFAKLSDAEKAALLADMLATTGLAVSKGE